MAFFNKYDQTSEIAVSGQYVQRIIPKISYLIILCGVLLPSLLLGVEKEKDPIGKAVTLMEDIQKTYFPGMTIGTDKMNQSNKDDDNKDDDNNNNFFGFINNENNNDNDNIDVLNDNNSDDIYYKSKFEDKQDKDNKNILDATLNNLIEILNEIGKNILQMRDLQTELKKKEEQLKFDQQSQQSNQEQQKGKDESDKEDHQQFFKDMENRRVQALADENKKLNNKVNSLEKELKTIGDEKDIIIQTWKDKLENVQSAYNAQKSIMKNSTNKKLKSTITEKLEKYKSDFDQQIIKKSDDYTKKLNTLKSKLLKANQEIENLKKNNDIQQGGSNKNKAGLAQGPENTQLINKKDNQIELLNNQIKQLNNTVNTLKREKNKEVAKLKKEEINKDNKIKQLNNTVNKLKLEKNKEVNELKEKALNEKNEWSTKFNDLNEQFNLAKKEVTEFTKVKNELNECKNKVKNQKNELDKFKNEVKSQKKQLTNKDNEIKNLNTKVKSQETDLLNQTNTIDKLKEQVKDLNTEKKTLQGGITDESTKKLLRDKDTKIKKLEKEMEKVRGELVSIQKKEIDLSAQKSNLEKEILKGKQDNDSIKNQHKNQINKINQKLLEVTNEVKKSHNQIQELTNQLEGKKKEVEELKKKLNEKPEPSTDNQDSSALKDAENKKLKNDLKKSEKEVEELKKKLNEKPEPSTDNQDSSALENAENKNKKLKNDLKKSENEVKELKNDIQKIKNNKTEDATNFKNKLSSLEQKLEEAKKRSKYRTGYEVLGAMVLLGGMIGGYFIRNREEQD